MEIDEDAALKACSIGRSQVLVENYASLGYESPQAMWGAFMEDEAEHIEAMVRFILVNGIDDDMRRIAALNRPSTAEDWRIPARVYNGPGYATHNYHGRMARAHAKWKGIPDTPWQPDGTTEGAGGLSQSELKNVQCRLRELGYPEVGNPDGQWGSRTRAGVLAFRADVGLPIVPGIDDQFLAALARGKQRAVSLERASTTAVDLREQGSETIKATDGAVAGAGGIGGLVIAGEVIDAFGGGLSEPGNVSDWLTSFMPLIDTLKTIGPWAIAGIAGYVIYQVWQARQARVRDHRTGKNAGPI